MLQIFVRNNIRIRGASTPLRSAVMSALTMDNPEYIDRQKKRRPTYGIDRKLTMYLFDRGDLIVPRGFWGELREILKTQGINPEKVTTTSFTELPPVDFGPWNQNYPLREYQTPAIEAAVEKGGTLVSPAGSGKTLMGFQFIYRKAQPALWLVHTTDLMYQAVESAQKYLLGVGNVGLIGDKELKWGSGKLFVATVQTLNANPTLISTLNDLVGTVVVDEAHHFPAPMFHEVVGRFTAKNLLGLTATPQRKDRLERYLYTGVGPICHEVERDALYDHGQLIKPEIEFVYTDFSDDEASDRNEIDAVDAGGEYMDYTGLVGRLIADEKRAKLVAEKILDEARPGCYSIVLTESVRYCFVLRDLVEKYAKARYGVVPRMAVVHGGLQRYAWRAAKDIHDATARVMAGEAIEYREKDGKYQVKIQQYTDEEMEAWQVTATQRKAIIDAAKDKQIDILFATQLAREGLDMPHLNVGHMAMPKRGDTQSDRKDGAAVEQEIGRIMRPDPVNPAKKAKWIDYVDFYVGVFQDQYYARRSVYKRLGLNVPKKKRTEKDDIMDFMNSGLMFDLPY